jgi:hypothetical protein
MAMKDGPQKRMKDAMTVVACLAFITIQAVMSNVARIVTDKQYLANAREKMIKHPTKIHKIELSDLEFHYLNMLLNEAQKDPWIYSPMTKVGYGFRVYAFLLQRKINGKVMPKDVQEAYKRSVSKRIIQELNCMERMECHNKRWRKHGKSQG